MTVDLNMLFQSTEQTGKQWIRFITDHTTTVDGV